MTKRLSASISRADPVFDGFAVLWLNGQHLRDNPVIERKAAMRRIIPKRKNGRASRILFDHIEREGKLRFERCAMDLEGIVAKRKRSRCLCDERLSRRRRQSSDKCLDVVTVSVHL